MDMTTNIGKFTNAGVGLNESVKAIQGIANLAAVSGSNSQQASTAMYQLSQALAAGTVKLMDWNSVVNAGMGGEMFQNALKETSRLLGTGADEAIAAAGSF
jgi:tape measure domain-containing protein